MSESLIPTSVTSVTSLISHLSPRRIHILYILTDRPENETVYANHMVRSLKLAPGVIYKELFHLMYLGLAGRSETGVHVANGRKPIFPWYATDAGRHVVDVILKLAPIVVHLSEPVAQEKLERHLHKLTAQQYKILDTVRTLTLETGAYASSIARVAEVDSGTVYSTLKQFTRLGWVKREEKPNEHRTGTYLYSITSRGMERLEEQRRRDTPLMPAF